MVGVVGVAFVVEGILVATNLVLTAALVGATVMLVAEGRAMREAQFAPGISVELVPVSDGSPVLNLVVRNYGAGPAHDISFELDGDLKLMSGDLSDHLVMREGLRYLAPGSRFASVAAATTLLVDNPPLDPSTVRRVRVTATFKSASGKLLSDESCLELIPILYATPPLQEIKTAIQKIAKTLAATR